jgi:hypothetical protein
MKLHERAPVVSRARLELSEALDRIVGERELTPAEATRILLTLAEQQTTLVLRFERHGSYEKKADEG